MKKRNRIIKKTKIKITCYENWNNRELYYEQSLNSNKENPYKFFKKFVNDKKDKINFNKLNKTNLNEDNLSNSYIFSEDSKRFFIFKKDNPKGQFIFIELIFY